MKRPIPATLTLWLVLIATIINITRVWTSISWIGVLDEFQVSTSPVVSTAVGGFWSVIGGILYWGLLQKKVWAGKMLIAAGAGYMVWYWAERMLLQSPRPNLIFAVILNLLLLVLIIITNILLSREAHEQFTENSKTE